MWWKELKTPLFTVLFVFLGLLLFTKLIGPIPFYVNNVTTNKASMFTVQGTGEATAVPDTAPLYFGVEKKAATVEAAKNEVNRIVNQLTNDLKALGVKEKDIKTTNFSVSTPYPYYSADVPQEDVIVESDTAQSMPAQPESMRIMPVPPTKPTGQRLYTVNANIEVRVSPIETAEKAIDAATRAGANQVGGIQFVINEEEQKKLEQQARKQAIENAKEKAKDIADAAGITLGKVVDVQESFGGWPVAYGRGGDMMLKSEIMPSAAPTELNPGESKISVSVTLSYETR